MPWSRLIGLTILLTSRNLGLFLLLFPQKFAIPNIDVVWLMNNEHIFNHPESMQNLMYVLKVQIDLRHCTQWKSAANITRVSGATDV